MTAPDPVTPSPPSARALVAIVAAALVAASVVTVLFVLPVEFRSDPTGFGRWAGLIRPTEPAPAPDGEAAPVEGTAFYETAFRSDTIDIPLRTIDRGVAGSELEYKVRMKAGDALIYSWTVEGIDDPEEFYFDFHGETPAGPENPKPVVIEYKQATGAQSHGLLVAPIPGVHGWYLQNQSGANVVVKLRLSGFYELIAPGEYGNTAAIVPKP